MRPQQALTAQIQRVIRPAQGSASMPRKACNVGVEELKQLVEDHVVNLSPLCFSSASSSIEAVHSLHCTFFSFLLKRADALSQEVVQQALPDRFTKVQKRTCATHLCVAYSDLLQKKRNRKRYTGEARKSVYKILFAEDAPASAVEPPSTPPSRRLRRKSSWPPLEWEMDVAGQTGAAAESVQSSPATVASSTGAVAQQSVAVDLLSYSKSLTSLAPVSPVKGMRASAGSFVELPSWWDSKEKKMCLLCPASGEKVYGEVEAGTTGYLVCTWPDGSKQTTSVSNLAKTALTAEEARAQAAAVVLKKPAAAELLKKPAAAEVLKKPAAAEVLKKPAAAAGAVAPAAAEGLAVALAAAEGLAVAPAAAEGFEESPGAAPAPAAFDAEPPALPALSPAARGGRKRKAEGLEDVLRFEHREIGAIKTYMGRDKAYIEYRAADGRWLSVVNFAKGQCGGQHKDFCRRVFLELTRQPGWKKPEAIALKTQLIAGLQEAVDVE